MYSRRPEIRRHTRYNSHSERINQYYIRNVTANTQLLSRIHINYMHASTLRPTSFCHHKIESYSEISSGNVIILQKCWYALLYNIHAYSFSFVFTTFSHHLTALSFSRPRFIVQKNVIKYFSCIIFMVRLLFQFVLYTLCMYNILHYLRRSKPTQNPHYELDHELCTCISMTSLFLILPIVVSYARIIYLYT